MFLPAKEREKMLYKLLFFALFRAISRTTVLFKLKTADLARDVAIWRDNPEFRIKILVNIIFRPKKL